MGKMKLLKFMIAVLIPVLILFLINEKMSSNIESSSNYNKIAMDFVKEKYGETSGFKKNYVSITKWIEVENQLSQEVIKANETKSGEMSKQIVDETMELVTLREDFKKLSLEVKDVTTELNKTNLPDDAKGLVLDKYNQKLDETSKKMDSISSSILSLSDETANPAQAYLPEKVAYANVTISFGGDVFGFSKKTFPVIIDISKKEVLDPETADQFTAVSQIVQENETHNQPSSIKVTFFILMSLLFVYVVHLFKRPSETAIYAETQANIYT